MCEQADYPSNGYRKPMCATIIFALGLLVGMGLHSMEKYGLLYNTMLICGSSLLFYVSQLNIIRLFNKSVSR